MFFNSFLKQSGFLGQVWKDISLQVNCTNKPVGSIVRITGLELQSPVCLLPKQGLQGQLAGFSSRWGWCCPITANLCSSLPNRQYRDWIEVCAR